MELSPAEAQKAVQELLRQPGNNICADCHAPSPTWASVNLGVFICLDCSAHHRAMGTHISKVKSTTLDKWNAQMVESLRRAGNTKANTYWEKGLPPNTPRPTTADARGVFIRQKYEQGKFRNELPAPPAAAIPVAPKPVQVQAPVPAAVQASTRRRRAPPGSTLHQGQQDDERPPAAAAVNANGSTSHVTNGLDLLDLESDMASHVVQQVQSVRPTESSFSFLGSSAPPPASPQPQINGHQTSMFDSLNAKPMPPSNLLGFSPSSSAVAAPQVTMPTSSPVSNPQANQVLRQVDADLEAIGARLKAVASNLEQLRGVGQARVDIRPFVAEVPFLQLNESIYQQLSIDAEAMKRAADALRRCADALEAGASRAQANRVKDELAAECAKLDALQMKTIDGLTGLDAQQMAMRKAASAKVAALVNEAQLLHAKALIQLSGPTMDQSRAAPPSTGFGFIQQQQPQPMRDQQAQGFSFMRAQPSQTMQMQQPGRAIDPAVVPLQQAAPIPSFLG